VAHDGVFTDDPGEAIAAYEQQVLGKKLMGRAGLELRPVASRGIGLGGLTRAAAANSTNVTIIWRAFLLKPRGRVLFVPPQGLTPADAGARLAEVGVQGPGGEPTAEGYQYSFDGDTATDRLVGFALTTLRALGYDQPNVVWNWLTRARDQVPH